MFQIQLLLPLYENDGQRIERQRFRQVASELTARFGGLTAHTRAPATGLWQESPGETARDDIVIYEVMADSLDRQWWHDYRRRLETRFRQEQIVIRAHAIELL